MAICRLARHLFGSLSLVSDTSSRGLGYVVVDMVVLRSLGWTLKVRVVETAWLPDSFGLNGALPQVSTLTSLDPCYNKLLLAS
jgi:hypothetical protein